MWRQTLFTRYQEIPLFFCLGHVTHRSMMSESLAGRQSCYLQGSEVPLNPLFLLILQTFKFIGHKPKSIKSISGSNT